MATTATAHLVIPGQVIATSSTNPEESNKDNEGFLRGHGTFVEHDASKQQDRLVASVCGIVHRVNKLITVIPYCPALYKGNVGDLVIGRISAVGIARWTVSLHEASKGAGLPLSGVHLPGGAQRMRTSQDARDMRLFLKEGDLVCAEVHKVQPSDGSLSLHTRSHRFTKLENGILIEIPPALVPRRKNHVVSMINDTIDALWGVNGKIWIQRKLGGDETKSRSTTVATDGMKDVADLQENLRKEHAETPVGVELRRSLARLRNSIECIRMVHSLCSPEAAEGVYQKSLGIENPSEMLLPENVLALTEHLRS